MIKFTLIRTHLANGKRRFTVCNYGYFRPRGQWEMIAINLRPLRRTLHIWREASYRTGWPVACGSN